MLSQTLYSEPNQGSKETYGMRTSLGKAWSGLANPDYYSSWAKPQWLLCPARHSHQRALKLTRTCLFLTVGPASLRVLAALFPEVCALILHFGGRGQCELEEKQQAFGTFRASLGSGPEMGSAGAESLGHRSGAQLSAL